MALLAVALAAAPAYSAELALRQIVETLYKAAPLAAVRISRAKTFPRST